MRTQGQSKKYMNGLYSTKLLHRLRHIASCFSTQQANKTALQTVLSKFVVTNTFLEIRKEENFCVRAILLLGPLHTSVSP